MISSLIGDLIDQCSKEIDTNYQCGDCGEISVTEKDLMTHIEKHHRQEDISLCEEFGEPVNNETDLNRHMKNHHTQDNDHNKILPAENSQNHVDKSNHQKSGDCQSCKENEKEERILRDFIEDRDDTIIELRNKIENLTKKNVALDKEVKQLKLAFNESMVEKSELKKELNSNIETLNDTLKKNVALNDELSVKSELICLLQSKESQISQEDVEVVNTTIQGEDGDLIKCKDCDFETRVKKYMRGHALAHEGQYMCQRGCNERFVTLSALDEHHTNHHVTITRKDVSFKCDICKSTFKSVQQLSHHIKSYHSKKNTSPCNKCGYEANNPQEMRIHTEEYHAGFQMPNRNICKYFMKGECIKGNTCRFAHPQPKINNSSTQNRPICRIGTECHYFYRGICRFVHNETGIKKPRNFTRNINQNTRGWCRFLEDCFKVPNCPYMHYEEVFPKLPATNNPPIGW